jgi:hypothetical protein
MSARFGWHLIPLSSSPSCRTSQESSSTASWPPTQQEHRRQSHCRPLPQCHTVWVRFCHHHHARPPHHTTSVLSSPSSPHGSRRSLPAGHAAASALVVVTTQSACHMRAVLCGPARSIGGHGLCPIARPWAKNQLDTVRCVFLVFLFSFNSKKLCKVLKFIENTI